MKIIDEDVLEPLHIEKADLSIWASARQGNGEKAGTGRCAQSHGFAFGIPGVFVHPSRFTNFQVTRGSMPIHSMVLQWI